jgi:hypothetical protein
VARPHPALLALAAGRPPSPVDDHDDGLLGSAIDHGLHGLLWAWARDGAPGYDQRARLAGLVAATRQRHARLWAALDEVGARLAAVDVEVLALKGVTAEARWYGALGERPSTDVDVLLAPGDAVRPARALRALDPDHPLLPVIDDLARRGAVQTVDLRVDGVAVDLHLDLLKLGYGMRAPERLWQDAVTLDRPVHAPGGPPVRVLGAEHALVHFLVHANKDSFPRLIGYTDVVRIARRDDLDWDAVERFVRDEGLDDVAAASLATITRTLGGPGAPAGSLAVPGGWRRRVWRATWPDEVTLLGSTGPARSRRQEVVPFLVRERMSDAVRAAWRVGFPARAAVEHQYPDSAGPYLVRLARGRARMLGRRRLALRVRHTPRPAHEVAAGSARTVGGATKASLLRARLAREPLWIDVSGRSMGRSVPGGGRAHVAAATTPARGEVWAYCRTDGSLVVHRARGATDAGWVFQGDACVTVDPPVPDERLVGRVVALDPARSPWRWGPAAGAAQRAPREAVATVVRAGRRARSRWADR